MTASRMWTLAVCVLAAVPACGGSNEPAMTGASATTAADSSNKTQASGSAGNASEGRRRLRSPASHF